MHSDPTNPLRRFCHRPLRNTQLWQFTGVPPKACGKVAHKPTNGSSIALPYSRGGGYSPESHTPPPYSEEPARAIRNLAPSKCHCQVARWMRGAIPPLCLKGETWLSRD